MVSDAGLEAHAKGAAVAVRHVSIRQHASAYVSIRQHTSAYVSRRMQKVLSLRLDNVTWFCSVQLSYLSLPLGMMHCSSRSAKTPVNSSYVSIRQHTSAYVSIR